MEDPTCSPAFSGQPNDAVFSSQERDNSIKRHRPRRPLNKLPPGQVSFRILLHVSDGGGIIGNRRGVLSHICRETSSRIHCEAAVLGSDHRIVCVVGSGSLDRRISLNGEEREVSSAQEATIKVWEAVAQNEGDTVCCKLLAHNSQIGAVLGKGGKNIKRMKSNSGAKMIKIMRPHPHYTANDHELIQITGGFLSVKKALIDVSSSLQGCPPFDKPPNQTPLSRHPGASSSIRSPDPHATQVFPNLSTLLADLPGNWGNTSSNSDSWSSEGVSGQETNNTQQQQQKQEVVFRMLCSTHAAGYVIGKKGTIVRAMENEAGASIKFSTPLTESREREVTISAWENLESCVSPAQNAVLLVFTRIIEGVAERGYQSGFSQGRPVTAKLLVASDLVGCLGGNEGKVLSEMRGVTGADIRILEGDQILNCASVNDVVVQITGEYRSVQNALLKVTGSLRDNLLPVEVLKEERAKYPYMRVIEDPLRNDPLTHNVGALSPPRLPFPKTLGRGQTTANSDSGSGLRTNREDLELGSRHKLATVTNTTVEIAISEHVFSSVYGEDGNNLDRIIQISGAKVKVHDPHPGEREGRVVISGTPDETLAAQSLLRAFIH
uniref:K Homology domain-containing protein n=1 Tax=Fagus sylvatica TaxID=28930 RepID=A0A2N9GM54_FAGSY